MMKVIEETWSEELNKLIAFIKRNGATQEELTLLSVISIIDEGMRELSTHKDVGVRVYQIYFDIEEYLKQEDGGT